jgi:hypothetical protein
MSIGKIESPSTLRPGALQTRAESRPQPAQSTAEDLDAAYNRFRSGKGVPESDGAEKAGAESEAKKPDDAEEKKKEDEEKKKEALAKAIQDLKA